MRNRILVVAVLLFGLIATVLSALSTKYPIAVPIVVQVLLGVLGYALGRRSVVPATTEKRQARTILLAILMVAAAYLVGAMLSPTGDPYSFLILSFLELPYAGGSFWLGRSSKIWRAPVA